MDALVVGGFAAFIQIGVFVFMPFATLLALYSRPFVVVPLLAIYAFSYLDGSELNVKKDRTWAAFSRKFWLFQRMRAYFPQRVHLPDKFPAAATGTTGDDAAKQYLFAFHPHGTMSDFRVILDGQMLDLLPGLHGRLRWLGASILFRLPVAREICLWTGVVDARRSVAVKVLKEGFSIGVIPGGEQEQLQTEYGKEEVYLKKRFGFVKLALQFGVPLVPCYVFGCVDLYRTSNFMHGIRSALVKKLGVCLPFCYGQFGLPLTPFKRPVDIVIGAPLEVGKIEEPTQEQVAEAHEKYVRALQELFDSNKARFGYGDRKLEIT